MRTLPTLQSLVAGLLIMTLSGCADAPDVNPTVPSTVMAAVATDLPVPTGVAAAVTAAATPVPTSTAAPASAPTVEPSPTPAPSPPQQLITIAAPQNGASLTNPFELAGTVALTPPDGRLIYSVSDVNGTIIASGTLTVNGQVNAPGAFNTSITYPSVQPGGALVRVASVDSSVSVAVQLPVVSAQPQQGITLNLNGVATKARGDIVPGYVNQRSYIDLDAAPEHLRILFDDDPALERFDPRQRQLLIIPLDDYRKLFGEAYAEQFESVMDTLRATIAQPDTSANRDHAMLPANDLQQAFRAQTRALSFNGGGGVRFVTQFTQEITPVTSSNLTYVFQGLTNDGAYYVAGTFPIANTALAADATQVPDDDRDQLKKDYDGYIANVIQTLGQHEQLFAPSLATLDAMIASLQISANPLAKPTPTPGPAAPAVESPLTGRAVEPLNIRATPSTRGRVLGQLRRNETATLIARDADTMWIQVRTSAGVTGWVSRAYLDTIADLSTLPIGS